LKYSLECLVVEIAAIAGCHAGHGHGCKTRRILHITEILKFLLYFDTYDILCRPQRTVSIVRCATFGPPAAPTTRASESAASYLRIKRARNFDEPPKEKACLALLSQSAFTYASLRSR
jgi:hypothetical protein